MRYYPKKTTNHAYTLLAVGLLIVGGLVTYDIVSGNTVGAADASVVKDSTTNTNTSSPLNTEQTALLTRIESLKLDGQILNDPAFKSLQDRQVTLTPQDVGKTNPFAPLGGTAAPTKTKK